ncbi:hypothetical protein SELMODRAFT_30228, partial [Selaginella moellendorffii]
GRAYYVDPIQFLDPDDSSTCVSFSSIFTFKLVQFNNSSYRPGDGMAFMIVSDPQLPLNSAGAYLGLTNASLDGDSRNHFLAVEFDTFQDSSAGDPARDHIGVNINGIRSVDVFKLEGELTNLLRSNSTLTAWVEYESSQQLLEIRVSTLSQRPRLPLLKYQVELAGIVQEKMYVGFSAATSLNYELHKILTWKFSTYINSSATNGSTDPNSAYLPENKSTGCNKWICKKMAIILLPSIGLLFLATVVLLFCFWISNGKPSKNFTSLPSTVQYFTLKQLSAATRSFSRKEMIGSGGFGKVYKGILPKDGTLVAVKLLSEASLQSERQFLAELSVIGRLQHRNLVSLKGWCHDKGKLLLVYEFMPNGSLDKHLFSADITLLWQQRFHILKGVGEALTFLHDGWEQRVIHRDVKAANVLLDSKFTARLGDFGLARLMEHSRGPQTMTKAGTTGYIAPELAYTGRATEKSDVYSFGILALEVVSGRRALDLDFEFDKEGVLLLDWIWQMHERGRLMEVVDAKLQDDFDVEQVTVVLYMALQCCHPDANDRPTMRKCCQMLTGDAAPLTPHASRPMTLYYYPDTPVIPSSCSTSEAFLTIALSPRRGMRKDTLLFAALAIISVRCSLAGEAISFDLRPSFKQSQALLMQGQARATNESLELTGAFDSSIINAGRVFYALPIRFVHQSGKNIRISSFNTVFEFQVNSALDRSNCKQGDGFAFVAAASASSPPNGSDAGYLGLMNSSTAGNASNHLFAVEFDSVQNVEFADPPWSHVGVNVNSMISLETARWERPFFPPFKTANSKAWIDYDASTDVLQVRVSNENIGVKPANALLAASGLQLSEVFHRSMFIGFSASSGSCNDSHEIMRWQFDSNYKNHRPSPPSRHRDSKSKTAALGFASQIYPVLGIALVAVGLASLWYVCLGKPILKSFHRNGCKLLAHFSYDDISRATGRFDERLVLGRGAFGTVYKAEFKGPMTVAVKILAQTGLEVEHQFLAELSTLGKIKHPNLVDLQGWCHSRGKLMLVYEYLPNGSLDRHLFSESAKFLSWERRSQIIHGVAEAIKFLHQGHEECILHRDIKAANVLLDKNFKAKLGDFGLARLFDHTGVLQTMTRIVTGRRTISPACSKTLIDRVWGMQESNALLEIVDERMRSSYNPDEARMLLHLGLTCCSMDADERPTMDECCKILGGEMPAPD